MQERQLLKIDPLFGAGFFTLPDIKQAATTIHFPVPKDANSLESFFITKDGTKFKQASHLLIDQLKAFAKRHAIDSQYLVKFEKNYLGYHGTNLETNKLYLPLYQEGMPLLCKILELMDGKKIPDAFCKTVIANLIEKIGVCPPGCHTHILDAYLVLSSYGNLTLSFAEYRRKLAEQFVLELIRHRLVIKSDWEVHYVNAVLNRYSDMLAIPCVEDSYAGKCRPDFLDLLFRRFEAQIHSVLSVSGLMQAYLDELSVASLPVLLTATPDKSVDILADFEKRLTYYGMETKESFYFVDDVVSSQDYVTYSLSWKADYILFASLFSRLKNGLTLFDVDVLNKSLKRVSLNDEASLFYFPTRSLMYAYVHVPHSRDNKFHQPFITYCILQLTNLDSCKKLLHFIQSEKISSLQRSELLVAMFAYLGSDDFKSSPDRDVQMKNCVSVMMQLMHDQDDHLDLFLEKAAALGLIEVAELLLSQGALIDGNDDLIPLFSAAQHNQPQMIQFLLGKGAEADTERSDGFTPLMVASESGHLDVVKILAEANANILAQMNDSDLDAFTYAVLNNRVDVCQYFIEVMKLPWQSSHPHVFCEAIVAKAADVLGFLLKKGGHRLVNTAGNDGLMPLVLAIQEDHFEMVRLLLHAGAKVRPEYFVMLNDKAEKEAWQHLLDQSMQVQLYSKESVICPKKLQGVRSQALALLIERAVTDTPADFTRIFSFFKRIDHTLSVFMRYQPKIPKRVSAVNNMESLLQTAYSGFIAEPANELVLRALSEELLTLSDTVKHDHAADSFFGRHGLFTKSRLAKELDRVVADAGVVMAVVNKKAE